MSLKKRRTVKFLSTYFARKPRSFSVSFNWSFAGNHLFWTTICNIGLGTLQFYLSIKKNSKSETCALLTGHFFNLKMHPFSVQFICITYTYLVVTSADVWRTVVCSGNRWRQEWRGYCRRREEQFFASCCKQTKNILESRLSNKSTFWNSESMYLQLWRKSTWFWRTVELWFGLV